jgi:tRNA(Arg) A34 adenosine deaminase TadA
MNKNISKNKLNTNYLIYIMDGGCSNTDRKYIDMAAREATKSSVLYRHGCIAVVSGKVMARGYNKYRTYSKDGLISDNCSCHAEIDVLRKCLKLNITKKISLYIVRISNAEGLLNSVPCEQCYNTMKQFPIKQVIYSSYDGEIKKVAFDDFYTNYTTSGQNILKKNPEVYLTLRMKN